MAALLRSVAQLRCARRGIHSGSVVPESTAKAFELIRSQPSQYAITSLKGTKYVLTPRDTLTVPHLRNVKVGSIIRLDTILEVGSREYTVRGNPNLPVSQVKVEATVVEHTKGTMEYIFKKKRRKGYQRTIQHKQQYTRLRIGEIHFPTAEPQPVVPPQA
ncbi:ribosomal protein L21-like protein [Crepidotus variabilis]|uniref:Large ribosomal subunit protein bL21m n=1 Tax=Crepidotus variabilis TaxID=179855 RepID=A0A9P6JS85_9AGAR|nr:ribosomal protein L21-like protein [Crepidotus variabilis]